jgi:hypothetical protein
MGVFSYLLTRPDSRYITHSFTSEPTLNQDLNRDLSSAYLPILQWLLVH